MRTATCSASIVVGVDEALEHGTIPVAEPRLFPRCDLFATSPRRINVPAIGSLLVFGGGRKGIFSDDDEFVIVCLKVVGRPSIGVVVVRYSDELGKARARRLRAV